VSFFKIIVVVVELNFALLIDRWQPDLRAQSNSRSLPTLILLDLTLVIPLEKLLLEKCVHLQRCLLRILAQLVPRVLLAAQIFETSTAS
jgi:hypothetical protein